MAEPLEVREHACSQCALPHRIDEWPRRNSGGEPVVAANPTRNAHDREQERDAGHLAICPEVEAGRERSINCGARCGGDCDRLIHRYAAGTEVEEGPGCNPDERQQHRSQCDVDVADRFQPASPARQVAGHGEHEGQRHDCRQPNGSAKPAGSVELEQHGRDDQQERTKPGEDENRVFGEHVAQREWPRWFLRFIVPNPGLRAGLHPQRLAEPHVGFRIRIAGRGGRIVVSGDRRGDCPLSR